jgi:hypothetical protein
MRPLLILAILFVTSLTSSLYADPCSRALERTVGPDGKISEHGLQPVLDFNGRAACMVELIALSPQYKSARTTIDSAQVMAALKTLKQSGSSVGTGGTTNLVSKGLTSNILSAAAEYGALTETTSNQTVTLKGALGGLPVSLINHNKLADCAADLLLIPCINHKWINRLNRVSYGVSFDTSQNSQTINGTPNGKVSGTAQPGTFTANAHQINQITGKVVLMAGNQVTPDNFVKKIASDLDGDVPKSAKDLDAARQSFLTWEQNNRSDFQAWQDAAVKELKSASSGRDLVLKWQELGCSLVNVLGGPINDSCAELAGVRSAAPQDPDLFKNAETLAEKYSGWVSAQYSYAECLRAKPVLSFEYNENRPASQPPNSVFRLIYDQTFKKWTLTFNGAASIYDSTPSTSIPGASRLRDVQAAAEVDYDLTSIGILGSGSSAGLAYYYQNQESPAILNVNPANPVLGVTFTGLPAGATQVFATKGTIHIAQAKLALGSGQSSFHFPVAVTWSNRTELVSKPEWRGQIGISYDFDSLFAQKSTP